jgi:prepilin peptidase CpaA
MGAGDVKLLAAFGAWVGPIQLLSLTFYTAVAGGVMALVVIAWQRKLATTFTNLWLLLCHWRVAGVRPLDELSLDNKDAPRLAYGLPIAVGAVLTVWRY